MLKARAGEVLIFGLSEKNLEKLKAGKPIHFHLSELDREGEVVIFYGATEAVMRDDLLELVGPETKFSDTTGTGH